MNRTRGTIGTLALAALLGATLAGPAVQPIGAQDTTQTPAATTEPQTEIDANQAAIASGKFPFGTLLVVTEGTANIRNAAGSEAATLTEASEGSFLTVQAGPEPVGGVDWYQVETEGGVTGWVAVDQVGVAKGGPAIPAGETRQVITDSLNLRAAAGTSGEVVSGLARGDAVTIISGPEEANDLDWYQVETEFGETGWLAAVYLGNGDAASTAAGAQTAETPAAEATATAGAAFPEGSFVFVNSETLNVRDSASIEGVIVTELTDGAIATVTGAPVTADDYDWYPVSIDTIDGTLSGWVAGSLLTGGITLGGSAVVADGPLNLRDTPALDGAPLGQLETGATLTVISGPTIADGIAWFEVQAGDLNGYAAGRYLEA